jgi:hypothetical protein
MTSQFPIQLPRRSGYVPVPQSRPPPASLNVSQAPA